MGNQLPTDGERYKYRCVTQLIKAGATGPFTTKEAIAMLKYRNMPTITQMSRALRLDRRIEAVNDSYPRKWRVIL